LPPSAVESAGFGSTRLKCACATPFAKRARATTDGPMNVREARVLITDPFGLRTAVAPAPVGGLGSQTANLQYVPTDAPVAEARGILREAGHRLPWRCLSRGRRVPPAHRDQVVANDSVDLRPDGNVAPSRRILVPFIEL